MKENLRDNDREERDKTPLARAYHWTNVEHLTRMSTSNEHLVIINEQFQLKIVFPGLLPQMRLLYFDSQGIPVDKQYTFCFINSPYPPEWQKYPSIFQALIRRMGQKPTLLSFDVLLEDQPEVVDLRYGIPYFNGNEISDEFVDNARDFKCYTDSIKPLQEYQEGEYVLPELLIPRHIPYDRLVIEPLPDFVSDFQVGAEQYH